MTRFDFIENKKKVRAYCQRLSWTLWHEMCDFVCKPTFKEGVYLKLDGSLGGDASDNVIGLLLNGSKGEVLLKQGEYLHWTSDKGYCKGIGNRHEPI